MKRGLRCWKLIDPLPLNTVIFAFIFGFLHGAFQEGGGLKNFLVADHITFEIGLPISYFLMLHLQAIEFSK